MPGQGVHGAGWPPDDCTVCRSPSKWLAHEEGGPIRSINSPKEFLTDNSRWFSKSKSALGETTGTRPSLSTDSGGVGEQFSSSPSEPQSAPVWGGRERRHGLHIGGKEAAESAEVGKNEAVQARPCQWLKQVSTSGHLEDGAREHTPRNLCTRSRGPERGLTPVSGEGRERRTALGSYWGARSSTQSPPL